MSYAYCRDLRGKELEIGVDELHPFKDQRAGF